MPASNSDLVITIDTEHEKTYQGKDIAHRFIYTSKEASVLSNTSQSLKTLFQPKLNDIKPYYETIKHLFYAGSLEQLETYVKQNPEILLKTFCVNDMKGTLVELAVIGLDQTINGANHNILSAGAAEKLLQIHETLEKEGKLPVGSHKLALEKAHNAELRETLEAKLNRELENFDALNKVFDAFEAKRPQDIPAAIQAFKTYVKNTKKPTNGMMLTNQYHVNLIHLNAAAFTVLATRRRSLPDGPIGKLAEQFCFEVIGGIQTELPPRARQLAKHGLKKLFNEATPVPRHLDINGSDFKILPTGIGDKHLGVSLFYADDGKECVPTGRNVAPLFAALLQQFSKPLLPTIRLNSAQGM